MSEKTKVYYKDFGAVGDGKANDFEAIRAAHEYANEKGLPVFAEKGRSYRIGGSGESSVIIKTSTDWSGAEIIFDDIDIKPSDPSRWTPVIKVMSDSEILTHGPDSELCKAINAAGGIKTTTKKLPYAPGHSVMLVPCNSNHRVYIRYGGNANDGQEQQEVMIIDGDGNIDKDTPALLDYDVVTSIRERRIDDEPITLCGGHFITRANRAPKAYTYYNRNIVVSRSNVTVKGMKHSITDEGDTGAPYGGFLEAQDLNNLTVEDCIFQAHRFYYNEDPSTGGHTCMGTYEITAGNSNKILYKNCRQSNYYDKDGVPTNFFFDKDGKRAGEGIWGVMGSNYSKNITYDGCKLNRYDAHAGVYNATIINSELIHICLIGGGTATVDNCIIYGDNFIILRDDFGSFWDGDVIIKNTEFICTEKTPYIIDGAWVNHNFGYKVVLPNVYIDGLKVTCEGEDVYLFTDYMRGENIGNCTFETVMINGEEVENKNPMSLPEKIVIKNFKSDKKIHIAPEGTWMNSDIKFEI